MQPLLPPSTARFAKRIVAALALMLLAVWGTGCHIVRAQYELEDRPTLVLVDDPDLLLGNPALTNLIAAQIALDLEKEKKLTKTVPLEKLQEIKESREKDYPLIPMDELGRLTGAEQVLHVFIDAVEYMPVPGLTQPAARIRVKLLDAVQSKRLFPDAGDEVSAAVPQRDVPVLVELEVQPMVEATERTEQALARLLAQKIAEKVAKLFYDHEEYRLQS